MEVKRPIVVKGDIAIVPLTQGKHAIIDARDVPFVEGRNWCDHLGGHLRWYAASAAPPPKRGRLYMHRIILRPPHGLEVDHINHNGLDNRRINLRGCSHGQNMANGRRMMTSSSQFRGVSWNKERSKWEAVITKDRQSVYLGRFATEIEAAKAYDQAALKLHSEFATLNFPARAASGRQALWGVAAAN